MSVDERTNRDPLIGRVVNGQYEIVELIGTGGMGSVYRAKQVGFDRFVAFKVLHDSAFADAGAMRRFQAEASVLNTLSHINVVKVIVFGALEGSNRPFLVLEYLPGGSLSDCISGGPLPINSCWEIFEQIAAGVGHAHDRNVLHRDIKPGNIMFSSSPNVQQGTNLALKVVDFGVAKLMEGQTLQKLTQTGAIIGTPLYMAPEQLQGSTQNAAADVYSIGCLMYECLFGMPPFTGESLVEVASKQISEDAEFPSTTRSGEKVPAGLTAILRKALEKEPEARIQNGKELSDWLRKVRLAPDTVPADLRGRARSRAKNTTISLTSSPSLKKGLLPATVVALILVAAIVAYTGVEANQRRVEKFDAELSKAARDIDPKGKPDLNVAVMHGATELRALYEQAETSHDERLKQKVIDVINAALVSLPVKSIGASPVSEDTLWMYNVAAHANSTGKANSFDAFNRVVNAAGQLMYLQGNDKYAPYVDEYASKAEKLWAENGTSASSFDLIRAIAGLLDASDGKMKQWNIASDPAIQKRLMDERLHYIDLATKIYDTYPTVPSMDASLFLPMWSRLAILRYDQLARQDNHEDAITFADRATTDKRWKPPTDAIWAQRLFWRAQSRWIAGKADESAPLWKHLISECAARNEHHAVEFQSYYFLANIALRDRRPEEAIQLIERGYAMVAQHRRDPKVAAEYAGLPTLTPEAEGVLANAYEQLRKFYESEKHIENAIALVQEDRITPPLVVQDRLKVFIANRDRLRTHHAKLAKRG